jgi:penicillin-binding protein 1C
MARQKELNINTPLKEVTLVGFLLVIPSVLIAIGDAVRFIVSLMFHVLSTTILTTGSVIRGFVRVISRLQKKIIVKFPSVKIPAFRWPKIRLPKISKPVIHFPKLPKFKKRLRRLPPPPVVIRMWPTKTEQIKSFIAGVCITMLFFFLPFNAYQSLKALPNPQLLTQRDLEVTTKIFDRNGILLYEIYTDQNRTPLPLLQIPKLMQEATISIEDKDFYKHPGFSMTGIIRAARETILNKQMQGGSTITQQLIKSALLSPEITVGRKVKEIILAFWAERIYSKNQILEMYLNQVPYGGTAWGIEAAAWTYFGTPVSGLNLAQIAVLAGLPAAPTEYSPFGTHPEKAFERQKEVLRRMNEDRYITPRQEQEALATSVRFVTPHVPILAPHFVMYVKDILEEQYGPRLVEQGGLRITTSLDRTMQEKAETIVRSQIDSLAGLRVGNGAALVTSPATGEILAMVGSYDYFDVARDGNVNVTTSLRQPGSSIKVVNYAAALENGFTAATILDDSPVVYQTSGSKPYAPVNYDGKFHGLVPLRYALGNSYNVPAVKTLAKIGVASMVEKGQAMGIKSWKDPNRFGLSLTLGGGDVTMLDMARVFGTLANGGREMELQPILEVTDYTGHVLEKNTPKTGAQAVKPEVAWIIGNILSDNTARIAAFGPNSSLVIPGRTVSVKTGTTDSKRDNWTIGYTPSLLTVVWVGNNNNAPMDPLLTSGITGAAPIWHDIMTEFLKDRADEVPAKPDGVTSLPCYFNRPEYFIIGTEPAGGRCEPIPTPAASPTP